MSNCDFTSVQHRTVKLRNSRVSIAEKNAIAAFIMKCRVGGSWPPPGVFVY